jgi:hypothetical protein
MSMKVSRQSATHAPYSLDITPKQSFSLLESKVGANWPLIVNTNWDGVMQTIVKDKFPDVFWRWYEHCDLAFRPAKTTRGKPLSFYLAIPI